MTEQLGVLKERLKQEKDKNNILLDEQKELILTKQEYLKYKDKVESFLSQCSYFVNLDEEEYNSTTKKQMFERIQELKKLLNDGIH